MQYERTLTYSEKAWDLRQRAEARKTERQNHLATLETRLAELHEWGGPPAEIEKLEKEVEAARRQVEDATRSAFELRAQQERDLATAPTVLATAPERAAVVNRRFQEIQDACTAYIEALRGLHDENQRLIVEFRALDSEYRWAQEVLGKPAKCLPGGPTLFDAVLRFRDFVPRLTALMQSSYLTPKSGRNPFDGE